MLLLTSTSDLVRVVTGEAADIEAHASWVDLSGSTVTPGRTNTASITTATTTTVVPSPAASTQRNVKLLSLRNNHASQQCNVTVEHTDGTTVETLMKVLLLAGETLELTGDGEWKHYNASGGLYPATGAMATQAEMESGVATLVVVSPGRQHFHPGHPKCRAKFGITGNLLEGYNITSISDDGTGLATVTIATDFSSADWCCLIFVERAGTALTVADAREGRVVSAAQAAGTVQVQCYDHTATTALVKDPTSWHMVGLGDQA